MKGNRWEIDPSFRHKMAVAARNLRRETTKSESILWNALRRKQLAGIKFRRQQPIGPFIVDFYAAQKRLVVEIDGPIHTSQVTSDQERQTLLVSLGLTIVRVSSDLVERDLSEATQRPSSPAPSPIAREKGISSFRPSLSRALGEGPRVRVLDGRIQALIRKLETRLAIVPF